MRETNWSLSTFGHPKLVARGQASSLGTFQKRRGGGFSVASHFLEQVGVNGLPLGRQAVIMVIEGESLCGCHGRSFSREHQT